MTKALWLTSKIASILPNEYDQVVPFTGFDRDSAGLFSTNEGGVFTVDEAASGAYLVELSARFPAAGGTYRQAALSVNGAYGVLTSTTVLPFIATAKVETPKVAGVVFLEAGDTISLVLSHDAGATLSALGRLRLTSL